jgi:hypothetical protein
VVPATTLTSHRIKPATNGVEASDQAKHHLIGMIHDSVFALVAKLRRAEDAGSVLEERWGEATSQMGELRDLVVFNISVELWSELVRHVNLEVGVSMRRRLCVAGCSECCGS